MGIFSGFGGLCILARLVDVLFVGHVRLDRGSVGGLSVVVIHEGGSDVF